MANHSGGDFGLDDSGVAHLRLSSADGIANVIRPGVPRAIASSSDTMNEIPNGAGHA